jgi:hypothetical protein
VRRILAVGFAAIAFVAAGDAGAREQRVLLGIFGSIERFHALTGQRSDVGHVIFGWGQTTFARLWPKLGPTPMVGFDTGAYGRERITPRQIARGEGDWYLFALNAAAAQLGRPLYIRPLGEMNGHWNPYSAYNKDGSARDAAHSTAVFRKAFARIYLILHGGPRAEINARLARLGLSGVDRDLPSLPYPQLRVVWNPQGYGSPNIRGNRAQAYYPGDAYVDVVGDDLYFIRGKAEWKAADALYRAHPSKPFAFPEWGLWGIDDPSFVARMAAFVRSHPRVELISYFNAKRGSLFDLGSKPRSLAAYRKLIVPLAQ